MLIVHVHVRVKPECVEAFEQATRENARNSVREPGIARFDVVRQADDPTRFVLVEVYRNADAPAKHKESAKQDYTLAKKKLEELKEKKKK